MSSYFIITALVLGVGGSLHCVGMCGPLVLRFSTSQKGIGSIVWYHAGRILVYALLGLLAGLFGRGIVELFPFQQYLSILAGCVMLLMIILNSKTTVLSKLTFPLIQFLSRFTAKQKSIVVKSVLQGVVNGILPCGLVYAAMAASIGVGTWQGSVLYMMVFGWGTAPVLLLLQLAGQKTLLMQSLRISYWLPVISIATAVLLILRGLNLGIPYVSPSMKAKQTEQICH